MNNYAEVLFGRVVAVLVVILLLVWAIGCSEELEHPTDTLDMGVGVTPLAVVVRWHWTEPTSGTPVDHYVVEIEHPSHEASAVVSRNSFIMNVALDDVVRIRVAGVDAEDRQGPFSEWSEYYTPRVRLPELEDADGGNN